MLSSAITFHVVFAGSSGNEIHMPELHRENGFVYYIWSNDHPHPAHIHVEKGSGEADLALETGKVTKNEGFTGNEVRNIQRIFEENSEKIWSGWREFFGIENP
jgi:hypothetical protein